MWLQFITLCRCFSSLLVALFLNNFRTVICEAKLLPQLEQHLCLWNDVKLIRFNKNSNVKKVV